MSFNSKSCRTMEIRANGIKIVSSYERVKDFIDNKIDLFLNFERHLFFFVRRA